MNTVQKYGGEGERTTPPTPAAQNEANSIPSADNRPAPITIGEFLARNTSESHMEPLQMAPFLDQMLSRQPVQYTSILDAIPLLRTFLPVSGADADYALLIRDQSIMGFVWLGSESYEKATDLNARLLMRAILELDITSIVLATTYSVSDSAFNDVRNSEIEGVYDSFAQFGVSLKDWLHIHPAHTESYMLSAYGEEAIGLSDDQVVFCYDQCAFPDLGDDDDADTDDSDVTSNG